VDSGQRNGEQRRGALPETVDAFNNAAPVIGQVRPYTIDFIGWLDDFSTTGGFFDALGANGRGFISLAENLPTAASAFKRFQFKRCPGGADAQAPDGSNVLSPELRAELECEESHRAVQAP
jgi:hypothetical protein